LLERLFLEERRRTKIIPNAFGERPVLKLMYAAVIRAAERWRGIAVGEFEQRQLERSAKSSAVLTLSAWRPPSLPDTRHRSENCEPIDENRGAHRRIGLQIDDLGWAAISLSRNRTGRLDTECVARSIIQRPWDLTSGSTIAGRGATLISPSCVEKIGSDTV
jgi:hypothetical protein